MTRYILVVLRVLVVHAVLWGLVQPATAHDCRPEREDFLALRARVLQPKPGYVSVVAHRSCFDSAPENSVAAVMDCWRIGVEVVENDVRMTRDGELVVFHDRDVRRMTGNDGDIEQMTLAQVRKLTLRERNGGSHAWMTGERIPTLAEYFDAIRHRVLVNFEVKQDTRRTYGEVFAAAIALADRMGVTDHLLLKIPDRPVDARAGSPHMLEALPLRPDMTILQPVGDGPGTPAERISFLEEFRPAGYEINVRASPYRRAAAADPRLEGRPVMVLAAHFMTTNGLDDAHALLDPQAVWGRLIADGRATMVMTDRAPALLRYLERSGLRTHEPAVSCSRSTR